MEMRGEKVDVNRIWQNVQQNMSGFENRAKAWGEEVTSTASNLGNQAGRFASTRGRSFAAEVAQSGRTVGRGIGHIIGVLFKAFFLFVFGIIAFFLFIAVVAFTAGGLARPVNDFILNGFWQKAFMWGTLVFFLAVPLIAIITWIVRRLMKVRSQKRYLGWTFGGLWTLGWISLFLLIATVGKDFRNYDSVPQNITLSQPAMNKMLVRVDEPRIRYSGTFAWINDDHDDSGWDLTEDSLRLAHVKLRVQKSPDQMYHVTIWRYSRGRNRNEAAARAERLAYTAASSDSSLILGSGYGVGRLQKFRAQRVIVEIQVPAGKQIRFDESVQNKLQGPVHVRHTSNGRWNNNEWEEGWDEENHYYFQWQPNTDYTMTETGELVDMSRSTTTESTDTYRYRGDSLDNQIQELQRQRDEENRRRDEEIERQRQRVEEENRRLQELQNTSTTENTSRVTRRNKPAIETTGIHTPIFSLII
jgi:hypothetical protein